MPQSEEKETQISTAQSPKSEKPPHKTLDRCAWYAGKSTAICAEARPFDCCTPVSLKIVVPLHLDS
jgi:hypothetical protein